MANYLVSYRPLCYSKQGREAIEWYKQPSFVDHSNRREPHLESKYPGVSSVCRGDNFAPKLEVGDNLAYITIKGKHLKVNQDHRCLVAILKIIKKCKTHEEAAEWYKKSGQEIPSNCMITDNDPLDTRFTAHPCFDEKGYLDRVQSSSHYLICEPIENKKGKKCLEINIPRVLYDQDIINIFGYIPCTQNPPKISDSELQTLIDLFE